MSVLDSLQSSLASARAELEAKKRQAEAYRAKAQEIGTVYEELKEKKKSMRTLKSRIQSMMLGRATYGSRNIRVAVKRL